MTDACPHCGKELGGVAVFRGICPFCHKVFEISNHEQVHVKIPRLKESAWWLVFFIFVAIVLAIANTGKESSSPSTPTETKASSPPLDTVPVVIPPKTDWERLTASIEKGNQIEKGRAEDYEIDKQFAIIQAKAFVLQNAFHPESTEFPDAASEYKVRNINGGWEVSSYARSKNTFGGYVINKFTVFMQRKGADWFGKVDFQD